jgi:hypothetical protein
METSEPQAPEKSWIIAPAAPSVELEAPETGLGFTVMLAVLDVATKRYHTSSSGVPVAQPTGMPALAVALVTLPVVLAVPTVRSVEPAQSSLPGTAGLETQMLKAHAPAEEVGFTLVKTRK